MLNTVENGGQGNVDKERLVSPSSIVYLRLLARYLPKPQDWLSLIGENVVVSGNIMSRVIEAKPDGTLTYIPQADLGLPPREQRSPFRKSRKKFTIQAQYMQFLPGVPFLETTPPDLIGFAFGISSNAPFSPIDPVLDEILLNGMEKIEKVETVIDLQRLTDYIHLKAPWHPDAEYQTGSLIPLGERLKDSRDNFSCEQIAALELAFLELYGIESTQLATRISVPGNPRVKYFGLTPDVGHSLLEVKLPNNEGVKYYYVDPTYGMVGTLDQIIQNLKDMQKYSSKEGTDELDKMIKLYSGGFVPYNLQGVWKVK